MRPSSIFSTPLIIATMAFAVVAFLFLIDTSINPDGTIKNTKSVITNRNSNTVACTEEAKLCPDGSYVGRSGPNCEFAVCPPSDRNVNVSTVNNNSGAKSWKTYRNNEHGFSFQYPESFSDMKEVVDDQPSWHGRSVAETSDSSGLNETILISILDKPFDPKTIQGLYGPIEVSDQRIVSVGGKDARMYSDGDAGCGGEEVLTSLTSSTTLWISFVDCDDGTGRTQLYEQDQIIRQILSSFMFTN